MRQYGFYLDADYCTGCNACVMACKDKNNLPKSMLLRRTLEMENESSEKHSPVFYITMSCNHCRQPSCVMSCYFGALKKRDEDGLVIVDMEKCRGCKKCISSCPYGALHINKDSLKICKCDGCNDLKKQGEAPACISACPMRALEFGPLEGLLSKHPDAVSIYSIMSKDKCTHPSFFVKHRRVIDKR